MRILGVGGSVHDFAACLLTDGHIEVAVEEERISRVKHHPLYRLSAADRRLRSVDYCLDHAGISLDDVDVVVANDLVYPPMLAAFGDCEIIDHHLAHASCCYYTSGQHRTAILVVDGFGSIHDRKANTVSYFEGDRGGIRRLWAGQGDVVLRRGQTEFTWRHFDHIEGSLGGFYSAVSEAIGFDAMEEGKMMGLAPYGTRRLVPELQALCWIEPDGSLVFGEQEREKLATLIAGELALASTGDERFTARADLALAAQTVLEELLLHHVRQLATMTDADHLCLTGGVFLNCLANHRIATETRFTGVHVHGAAGDSGTAIGAALWGHARHAGPPPVQAIGSIFSGRPYADGEAQAALSSFPGLESAVVDDVVGVAAELIASGAVIGWFQGRSEFGPRALGNRSILADPRRAAMKDLINEKVKRRETFRPFAPAILAEAQTEFYRSAQPSPYMTFAPPTRPDRAGDLASVTHVDGTGRIETVSEDLNPRFHQLLRRFGELTGVPALLNTSFNEQEPIVETPADALRCFAHTAIDYLVLQDRLVWKAEAGPPAVLGLGATGPR